MFALSSMAVVAAVALLVPAAFRLINLRLPSVVGEILLGIVVGPQVLNWARVDEPVQVLATIGLAFLLLLSGLEIEFQRLRGRVLRLTALAFATSFAIAAVAGQVLGAVGLVRSPLLIAVILSATSLGVILPILKDAGQAETPFGQVVIAGASIAEVVPIVLLSLLFSERAPGTGSQLVLLATFTVFVAVFGLLVFGVERLPRITTLLIGLQETTAEIRVRGAMALLALFAALATRFGLEAILGAFLAGATLNLVDRDENGTHALFRVKLRAVGFGVFVPFFFISTGMTIDVRALADTPATLARVPIFLGALLIARAVPAVLYRPLARRRRQLVAAGLLQATSLSLPVVAGTIGVDLHLITPDNYAALVTAGLLTVVVFPLLGTSLMSSDPSQPASAPPNPRPYRPR